MAVALDEETVAFMMGGTSMHAASCGADLVPNLSRPVACRVSEDRTRVTVFMLASHSGAMLADFRANGRIAVVITMPSTHRTIQLKGEDAAVEPLRDDDPVVIARHREAFARDLERIGFARSVPVTLLEGTRGDIIAVAFTVSAAFTQTPGPGAGAPLKP